MTSNNIIGIAGGIGSGKSTITAYLRECDFTVVDADEISRKLTEKGTNALGRIRHAFGNGVVNEYGELDRKAMAKIVFSDKKKLGLLNDILHEEISLEVDRLLAIPAEGPVFLSAPLFFEAGYEQKCHKVLVIAASKETRARRAGERDGVSPDDIRMRMMAQMPDETLIARADEVIINEGTKGELIERINDLLKRLEYED